jgi:tRNA dimethylallyltransferase
MAAKSKPTVIAVVGPTASGKSGLAIAIAKKLGGEVISADSRQVYKGLNIGTGKVTKMEMQGVPHHLLDITSPKKQLSVEEWKKKAEKAITDIHGRGKVAIVCGGTGLYIDSLLRGLSFPEVPPNLKLRKLLEKRSTSVLFAMLKKLDPHRASEIDQHNPRRLIRAIEIAKALGNVPTKKLIPPPYQTLWIGINPSDAVLKKRIHVHLLARMKLGMVHEAEKLHREGLSYKRMRELGLEYRFLADLLEKKLTKKEMLTELEQAIWQYAKRQRTWWKKHMDIHWMTEPSIGKTLKFLYK